MWSQGYKSIIALSCACAVIPSVNVEGKMEDLEQKLNIVLQNVMVGGLRFQSIES